MNPFKKWAKAFGHLLEEDKHLAYESLPPTGQPTPKTNAPEALLKSHGKDWFEQRFLAKFHPVMICSLLLTLVLIFAFQAENLTRRWLAVLLIAVPILIQVYFNSGLTYLHMRWFRVPHNVGSPGALIGASNFFELAVAVAITLFGPSSGAALATVVGVLVEVPVMLSVCNLCNASPGWYEERVVTG